MILVAGCWSGVRGQTHVAVASNFTAPVKVIAESFEEKTGHEVTLSFGSTGKFYAQITHGAPFDVFLAADVERPRRLEDEGLTLGGSRFTYAIGKLVLWSATADYVDSTATVLASGDFRHLAIANPKLAPYGRAAREILEAHDLWSDLRDEVVYGENIAQTFQFVRTGNAELGFVAFSQIKRPDQEPTGSYWVVPQSLYTPVRQQAVLLSPRAGPRAFLEFLKRPQVEELIERYGYTVP